MRFGRLATSDLAGAHAQVGAEIVKRALGYPLKLIANNAGVNGSVVMQKVMDQADKNIGYNAATGKYEDLMAAGIIDPTKVVRCSLENAASVAKTFLTSDVVVTEIPEPEPAGAGAGGGMDAMGGCAFFPGTSPYLTLSELNEDASKAVHSLC